jgi:hypothetical protein
MSILCKIKLKMHHGNAVRTKKKLYTAWSFLWRYHIYVRIFQKVQQRSNFLKRAEISIALFSRVSSVTFVPILQLLFSVLSTCQSIFCIYTSSKSCFTCQSCITIGSRYSNLFFGFGDSDLKAFASWQLLMCSVTTLQFTLHW